MGLLALLAAAPATADLWYEHYDRAERALADGHWTRAVRELNDALERRGDSGARVRTYGMNVTGYFPYFKLGVAYYHLGQLDAAEQAFETEERIGAITSSRSASAELGRYRELVGRAREEAAVDEQRRVRAIVTESVAQAERAEAQGKLEEAINSLARALAVSPDDSQLQSRMAGLREAAAQQLRAKQDAQRVAALVAQGEELLAGGDYREAASRLRQALDVMPDGRARILLQQAQERLRGTLPSDDQPREREALLAGGMSEARTLVGQGEIERALNRLEGVLALDPTHTEAQALQQTLLQRRREDARSADVAEALHEAEVAFAAGRFEASLSAANRALALEGGNQPALERVRLAYREISQRLLGSSGGGNIPPAIRFSDLREETSEGSRRQVVTEPSFRLTGVVIDSSPVTMACRDQDDREVPVAIAGQAVGDYTVTEFTVQRRLPVGVTSLRVVATDSDGLSSSSEYSVHYERPLLREPWFQIALAAAPLAIGGLVYGRRRRRRRELLRRRFNPFVAGAPVLEEKLFVGRERLIQRILETVHNNSLLLFGERRIGKTSIQHHLRRRLETLEDPDYQFFPVFVDLQGVREERFFANLSEEIFAALGPRLGGLTPHPDLVEGAYGHRELVADLRGVIAALSRTTSKKVKLVLLIDEVDELNAYDPRVNQRLRSLFMKSFAEHLVAVVSGVEISRQWDKEGSPWYNFFEEIEVEGVDRDAAERLIRRPIQGVLRLDRGVVERICELSDCKPYRIQKICIAAVNRVHEVRRRTITVADIETVAGVGAS